MRIAVAQLTASTDLAANREEVRKLASQAAANGAQMAVFPEASMRFIGPPSDDLTQVAETLDGPFVATLRDLARQYDMAMVAGMFEQLDDDGPGQAYNTVVVVDSSGELVGSYRKIHLFDALGVEESGRVRPGNGEVLTFSLGGHLFGVMTCYDIRFPELARVLADRGVDTLLAPTAWRHGLLKEAQWLIFARARAIENTCWLVGAAQVGGVYSGNSVVVDPMGVVVAALGEEPGLLMAEISAERTASVRSKLPLLENRRYRVEWAG